MNIHCKKIFVWSISLFLLVGFTTAGHNHTLCIGTDREIEKIDRPCCVADADNSNKKERKVTLDDCENCTDIELDSNFWTQRTKKINSNILLKITLHHEFNSISNKFTSDQISFYVIKPDKNNNRKNYSEYLSSIILLC